AQAATWPSVPRVTTWPPATPSAAGRVTTISPMPSQESLLISRSSFLFRPRPRRGAGWFRRSDQECPVLFPGLAAISPGQLGPDREPLLQLGLIGPLELQQLLLAQGPGDAEQGLCPQ